MVWKFNCVLARKIKSNLNYKFYTWGLTSPLIKCSWTCLRSRIFPLSWYKFVDRKIEVRKARVKIDL